MSIDEQLRILLIDIAEVASLRGPARDEYFKNFELFPPSLPTGCGQQILLSKVGAGAVQRISKIFRSNHGCIAARYTQDEMLDLLRRTIGGLLVANTCPEDTSFKLPDDVVAFKKLITSKILDDVASLRPKESHVFGVWVFSHAAQVQPLSIGPVWLGARQIWLNEVNFLDPKSKTRIGRAWNGQRLTKRPPQTFLDDRDIVFAIGPCPWVCTVDLGGHASARSCEKAILAARIALASIALCFDSPSRAANQMGLLADGERGRSISFAYTDAEPVGVWRQNRARRGEQIGEPDERSFHKDFECRFETVGEALRSFLSTDQCGPNSEERARLCFALTWFWEACNASSDFMAITKFATSMDVLSDGQDAQNLSKMLHQWGGHSPDQKFLADGTTASKLMHEVYNKGRSQFLHGNRRNLVEDLAGSKRRAELLACFTLNTYISWLAKRSFDAAANARAF